MKGKFLVVLCVLGLFGAMAHAQVGTERTLLFDITMTGDNELVAGSGNGYPNEQGEWYQYPSGWWNQWQYNDPFDPNRYKVIEYDILVTDLSGCPDTVIEIALNWSTPLWDEQGTGLPPLPDDPNFEEALHIERELIFSGNLAQLVGSPGGEAPLPGRFDILDYNPEWVSIDVRTSSGVINNAVSVSGTILHQCVPEPATLALLSVGGVMALRRRRQR